MNVFALAGDVLHLASIFILLLKIFSSRSCRGISYKTQLLYVIVFVTRYVDLVHFFRMVFVDFQIPSGEQLYLNTMKIIYITLSSFIVYVMRNKSPWKETYDKSGDSFRLPLILIPCMIMAVIWNEERTIEEILYTFSLWLEAVAIVPQLYIVHQMAKDAGGFVENLTSHYVFTLGGYRVLYAVNWIYKACTLYNYWHPIIWVTGTLQSLIYLDFFYYYITAKVHGKDVLLPV